jgi:hypothetical protein
MAYRTKVDTDDPERRTAGQWRGDIMAKKRDPQSHPPTSPTRTIRKDISKVVPRLQARLKGGHENPVRVSSGGEGEWPAECPVRIDVHMVMGLFNHDAAGPAEGLMGHIIDMDFYTKQSRVLIKMYRDPNALAIIVNDEEVYRWVENNDDLPVKFFSVIEDMNSKAEKWVDQVQLQPGDEVLEDEYGQPVIVRAEQDDDPIIEEDEDDMEWE